MRRNLSWVTFFVLLTTISLFFPLAPQAAKKSFVHPGLYQTKADLEFIKQKILAGEQPWKDAARAIEILHAWSPNVWDFDYNDAKLLVRLTGHQFYNAAEILRHTDSGWDQRSIESFKRMLLESLYPCIRYYYPEANGNWDGAIIQFVMAIAVFADNRPMFDHAVDHYLHGHANGNIFKYTYPNGQCQESTRDQGHVQLGLGEFAGAARIAQSQGVDLFSSGNNRLALGYEYTMRFLNGDSPFCYETISSRAKELSHACEAVYQQTHHGRCVPTCKKGWFGCSDIAEFCTREICTAI